MSKDKVLQVLNSLQQKKQDSLYWNITWRQGVILSTIIETFSPKTILEIGTSNGFSTLWMKYGFLGSSITTVDINKENTNLAKKNFKLAGVEDSIEVVNENIFNFSKRTHSNKKYDLVFFDALQQEYETLLDLILENKLLNKNHILIFDNVISHKKDSILIEILTKNRYCCDIIEEGDGFLIANYGM